MKDQPFRMIAEDTCAHVRKRLYSKTFEAVSIVERCFGKGLLGTRPSHFNNITRTVILSFDKLQAATSETSFISYTHYNLHQHFMKASYPLQQPISPYQTGLSLQLTPYRSHLMSFIKESVKGSNSMKKNG